MTLIQTLAEFTANTQYGQLPAGVIAESKRILLDSVGCALGGHTHSKGQIGVEIGHFMGAGSLGNQATIIGGSGQASPMGAMFANGELINALDFDAVLPPGHVTPYVLPGILAAAEQKSCSGQAVIEAIALSHEMSNRLGKALDYLRDIKDGKVSPPPVYGYASTIFGATAAIGKLYGLDVATLANGLGIAACITPVNTHWPWTQHAPATTIKYGAAGPMSVSAMMAAKFAQLGHRGDLQVLDDADYGFRKFVGSARWEPQHITPGLGRDWNFIQEQAYKPYPHCRVLHALLDCERQLIEENGIQPEEITGIHAWVEAFVLQPLWLVRKIEHITDAQFSVAHGLSLGAHRIPVGKQWQSEEVVFNPSVLSLMDRVTFDVHPDYERLLQGNAASRPARIEISARGQTFVAEARYPKGSPSPEASSFMTNAELIAKYRENADGILGAAQIEESIDLIEHLETLPDISALMRVLQK